MWNIDGMAKLPRLALEHSRGPGKAPQRSAQRDRPVIVADVQKEELSSGFFPSSFNSSAGGFMSDCSTMALQLPIIDIGRLAINPGPARRRG
jgi:hypothetical protein